jgi:hypothetical protein
MKRLNPGGYMLVNRRNSSLSLIAWFSASLGYLFPRLIEAW